MPATATYSPTGDPYIDGVLYGRKWAVDSLTFSFPSDASFYGSGYGNGEPTNNFQAFNATQEYAVRTVLDMYASVVNVTFSEVTESATKHGDLRFAESDAPTTAWAYYPSTAAEGGDAWFNSSRKLYDNPVKGNYAWLTMMHEIGHAMGLKHPQDAKGSFGALPLDRDSLEYSVMSYRSYIGGPTTGYTLGSTSYPQSLMMLDIAALQYMYGANYATNAGDTVYRWSPTTGEMFIDGVGQVRPAGNKVFLTIWDGGGNDTYDFSNYSTNLQISLQPGEWTTVSTTQLASLGSGHVATGNIANALLYNDNPASLIENAIGGSGNDVIIGNMADNMLVGGAGNDVLDGVGGTNTAVYSGLSTDYHSLDNGDGTWTITDLRAGGPDGVDTLQNIQWLKFSDATVSIGTVPQDPQPPRDEPTDDQPVDNTAPTAFDDSYSTNRNSKLTVDGTGVLANDTDAEADTLSAILVQGPQNGSLTLNSDGSFVYTPNKNYAGDDSFTYRASDGTAESDVATVAITVVQPSGGGGGGGKGKKGGSAEDGPALAAVAAADAHRDFGLPDAIGAGKGRLDDDHDVTEDQIPEPAGSGDKFDFAGLEPPLGSRLGAAGHDAALDSHVFELAEMVQYSPWIADLLPEAALYGNGGENHGQGAFADYGHDLLLA